MQVQFSVVSCPIYAGGRIVKIEGIDFAIIMLLGKDI